MATVPPRSRARLDGLGILLSGLCAGHCLLGLLIVAGLGLGGGLLLDPAIHKIGLLLAVLVAGPAIGLGTRRHGRPVPLVVAGAGLALMAAALIAEHGLPEVILTIAGVVLVGLAHLLNVRPSLPRA